MESFLLLTHVTAVTHRSARRYAYRGMECYSSYRIDNVLPISTLTHLERR